MYESEYCFWDTADADLAIAKWYARVNLKA